MKRVLASVALALVTLGASALAAHHSGSEYDRTTVEIEGTLVELVWQNPHVHFGVRAVDSSGKAHFTINDETKRLDQIDRQLCPICGTWLKLKKA